MIVVLGVGGVLLVVCCYYVVCVVGLVLKVVWCVLRLCFFGMLLVLVDRFGKKNVFSSG